MLTCRSGLGARPRVEMWLGQRRVYLLAELVGKITNNAWI